MVTPDTNASGRAGGLSPTPNHLQLFRIHRETDLGLFAS